MIMALAKGETPRSRRGGRPKRRGLAIIAGLLGVLLLALAWVGVRGLLARRHLEQARSGVADVRSHLLAGDSTQAAAALAEVQGNTAQARRLTADPIWRVVASTPYAGRSLRTAGGLAATVDDLARQTLPDLLAAGAALAPSRLRTGAASVNLAPLQQAQTPLAQAATTLDAVSRRVVALPHRGILAPVASAVQELERQLASISGQVRDASAAARLLPPMLGASGPRRYFVAMQNNAEARGTGGLLGAFMILEADQGRVQLARIASNAELPPVSVTPLEAGLPPEYMDQYGNWAPLSIWADANVSPHFPYAAQIWAAMWRKSTGQSIDGVIALDPFTLSYLLQATGPVQLADGTAVSADNAVSLILKDEYATFPDVSQRKQFLVDIGRAVVEHILNGAGSPRAIVTALGRAGGEGRLLIATPPHPDEQSVLEATPLSGVLPDTAQPMTGVVVNDAGGSKLDYYLSYRLLYSPSTCSAAGRQATAVIVVTNTAPTSGLPDYPVMRVDRPPGTYPRGQTRVWLSYFGTSGAGFSQAMVDGAPALLESHVERGHSVFSLYLSIDPGQQHTVTLSLMEPPGAGRFVKTLRQPSVIPPVHTVKNYSC